MLENVGTTVICSTRLEDACCVPKSPGCNSVGMCLILASESTTLFNSGFRDCTEWFPLSPWINARKRGVGWGGGLRTQLQEPVSHQQSGCNELGSHILKFHLFCKVRNRTQMMHNEVETTSLAHLLAVCCPLVLRHVKDFGLKLAAEGQDGLPSVLGDPLVHLAHGYRVHSTLKKTASSSTIHPLNTHDLGGR